MQWVQDDGLKAIANLEEAFKECDRVVESQDKQAIPSAQQNALTYVGQIEEAMMKGFPFEVPSQYDNLPQLKVCVTCRTYTARIILTPSPIPCVRVKPVFDLTLANAVMTLIAV